MNILFTLYINDSIEGLSKDTIDHLLHVNSEDGSEQLKFISFFSYSIVLMFLILFTDSVNFRFLLSLSLFLFAIVKMNSFSWPRFLDILEFLFHSFDDRFFFFNPFFFLDPGWLIDPINLNDDLQSFKPF